MQTRIAFVFLVTASNCAEGQCTVVVAVQCYHVLEEPRLPGFGSWLCPPPSCVPSSKLFNFSVLPIAHLFLSLHQRPTKVIQLQPLAARFPSTLWSKVAAKTAQIHLFFLLVLTPHPDGELTSLTCRTVDRQVALLQVAQEQVSRFAK